MAHVFDFGATGDGQTDDTDALQHAIDDGDGVLRFNKGTYRITRPLVIDTTKTGWAAVRGEAGTTRIVMEGAGPAIRILGDHRGTANPGTVKEGTWERERFPTVSGIEILGRHPEADGIQFLRTMQATVSQVLIRDCRYGVHLVERNRNFLLTDSHIYNGSEYGVYLDRCNLHQTNITGCHISYNKRAGIRALGGDLHNFQITGNDIEYNNNPGVDESPDGEPRGAEIWLESDDGMMSEVTIASNTIQATVQPGGANIRIWGIPDEIRRGARLIAISGNVIGSNTRGIELRHVQRVAISGNTIYDSDDLSILADHCSGMAVGSNTFIWRGQDSQPPRDGIRLEDCDNCILSGLAAQRLCAGNAETGAGVTFVRCHDCAISESQLLDSLHRGIELEDCRRCRVAGNTIVDRRPEPTMREAIRIRGNSRDNLIQNNMLGGAVGRLLDIPDGTAVVQGNLELTGSQSM